MTDLDTMTIKHDRFNGILVDNCKKLGGRWNRDKEYWEFSKFVNLEKVKKLDSLFNENLINVEITAKEDIKFGKCGQQIYFFGYKIVERISDEKLEILKGSVFKIKISKDIIKKYKDAGKKFGLYITDNEKWDIKILN